MSRNAGAKQVTRTSRRQNKKIVEARGWEKRDLSWIVRVFDKNDDFAGGTQHTPADHRPNTNTRVYLEEMWHLPQSRESCKKLPQNNNNNNNTRIVVQKKGERKNKSKRRSLAKMKMQDERWKKRESLYSKLLAYVCTRITRIEQRMGWCWRVEVSGTKVQLLIICSVAATPAAVQSEKVIRNFCTRPYLWRVVFGWNLYKSSSGSVNWFWTRYSQRLIIIFERGWYSALRESDGLDTSHCCYTLFILRLRKNGSQHTCTSTRFRGEEKVNVLKNLNYPHIDVSYYEKGDAEKYGRIRLDPLNSDSKFGYISQIKLDFQANFKLSVRFPTRWQDFQSVGCFSNSLAGFPRR